MELLLILLVIACVVLFVMISDHSAKLRDIEWKIKILSSLTRRVEELESEIQDRKKSKPSEIEKEGAPKVLIPEKKNSTTIPTSVPSDIPTQQMKTMFPEVPTTSRTREEWESLIGGKLMNRIGSLALIIGVGFFLKYAFDNNWISETIRVLIGAVIGFSLLASGFSTHKKGFAIFAQGLVGAGISILYLSIYASFNFYHLIPQWTAFGMMLLVTALTFWNGLYYDSLAVALLGWVGGFLTPILLSTGEANEVGLMSYIFILDVGLAALIVKKESWKILEPLTFVATWLMFLAWYENDYSNSDLGVTIFFISIFWGIFLFLDMFRSRLSASTLLIHQVIPGLNALVYYTFMYVLIDAENHQWMSMITLSIGGVYLLMFVEFRRRGILTDLVRIRYTLTAIFLLAIAIAIQFDDFTTIIFWSIEAAALIVCAVYWKFIYLKQVALTLFGITIFKLLLLTQGVYEYIPLNEFSLIINQRAASFVALAGSLLFSAHVLKQWISEKNAHIVSGLHYCWIGIVFLLLTIETNDYFHWKILSGGDHEKALLEFTRQLIFSVVWLFYSAVLVAAGLRKKITPIVLSGLTIASIGVLFGIVKGIEFVPIEQFSLIVNIRFLSLILLTFCLIVLADRMRRSIEVIKWKNDITSIIHVAIILVIYILLTGETRDFFQKDIMAVYQQTSLISTVSDQLVNLQQLSLSAVWLAYSVILMSVGIWRRFRGMRFAAIILFGITVLKIFIYDLSFLETLYRIFSFMGLGIILLGVSYVYQRFKGIILGKE